MSLKLLTATQCIRIAVRAGVAISIDARARELGPPESPGSTALRLQVERRKPEPIEALVAVKVPPWALRMLLIAVGMLGTCAA